MVHRYQGLLREDEDLSNRLAHLRVSPRRILPFALAALCVTLFVIANVVRDWGIVPLLIIACSASVLLPLQYIKERRIVQHWSAAVGTVLSRRKTGRRGVEIKYAFRAADGQVHLGKGIASPRSKEETLGVVYEAGDPTRSLPQSQFWFYEFSLVPQSQNETEAATAPAGQRQPS